jgi:hypothetical protein
MGGGVGGEREVLAACTAHAHGLLGSQFGQYEIQIILNVQTTK